MSSKAVGYYISVESLKNKGVGKGKEWVYEYQSPTFPTKQFAFKWAYYNLPVTKYGFLMRAHADPDDDEMWGRTRYVRRKCGPVLIYEDEDSVYGDDYGYRYDVTERGTLVNKR